MTEDEAKTKWCPHAVNFDAAGTATLPSDNPYMPNCLASACMAWRWRYEQANKDQTRNSMTWPMPEPIYRKTEHGYCGLAGRDQ